MSHLGGESLQDHHSASHEYVFSDSSYIGSQFLQQTNYLTTVDRSAIREDPPPSKYSSEKDPTTDASEPATKSFNAPCCNGECNNQVAQQAPSKPTGKQIFCEFCGKVFAQEYVLKIHRRKHTGEKPYQCEICSKKFARNDTLQKHKRIHLPKPNTVDNNTTLHGTVSTNPDLSLNQRISVGENGDQSTVNLEGLLLTSPTPQQVVQGGQVTSGNVKSYNCDICLKPFAQRHYLQIHKRSHTGERPFQCQVCSRSFTRRDTLLIHQRTHTGVKPFQCDVCLQQFAHKHNLQIHRRKHTGEKLFQCDICAELFTRRDYLQIHRRTHTGEKPFQCDLCIQKFARRTTLEIHRRTHTGEKPFHCEFCSKQFSNRDKLRIHQRTHVRKKPHQCPTCLKKFARRDTLEIHSRRHTGLKPYNCDICLKRFAQKDYLQVHRRSVHSGQKPFHCDQCTQKFSRRDSLQRHKKTHNKQALDEVQKATSSIENNTIELQPLNKYMWLQ